MQCAYYAIFDAARAALLASDAPVQPDVGKTHSGLISTFGLHLVKHGPFSKELGRLLKRAEEMRNVADYQGDSVQRDDARQMVEEAQTFVQAMRNAFLPPRRSEPND